MFGTYCFWVYEGTRFGIVILNTTTITTALAARKDGEDVKCNIGHVRLNVASLLLKAPVRPGRLQTPLHEVYFRRRRFAGLLRC